MNPIRIGRPRARALSPDPPDPDIARAKGARADRAFRNGARDMMAWAWQAPMAGCLDNDPRGPDGPPRAGAHVGMHLADQRGGAAHRRRSAALGSIAGRLPAHRQPPASPGPERNGAVTRAGGRGPRSRPQHRQRIRQDHPGPPDRHQLHREPSVMCSSRRRPANVRSSPAGKNIRAHYRQPAHRHAEPAAGKGPWPMRCTSTADSCAPSTSAAMSSAKNSGGGTPPAQQGRERCCSPPVPPCCRHG